MPKPNFMKQQDVLEVRYKQGYRYLDRCGDAMVLLEDALPAISGNKIWMPENMAPQGAIMKCPDLDLALVFDAARFCLDQNPTDIECPFEDVALYAFGTIAAKFAIEHLTRLGRRQRFLLPVDSIEDATKLSLMKLPLRDWPVENIDDMSHQSSDATCVLESKDRSKGVRFSVRSVYKIDAPNKIDPRLKRPPHLLEKGQREALINQLRRAKQRQEDPAAGLEVDIDYWWMAPEDMNIKEFYEKSTTIINDLINPF